MSFVDAQIRINEISSANESFLDEENEADDWIEIYNLGTEAIDLNGYYISDDPSLPQKHELIESLPGDFIIDPNGYLILWADKDIQDGIHHLNFSLNHQGEDLMISDNELNVVATITIPYIYNDISYGYNTDDEEYKFYLDPSPGEVNSTISYEGILNPPTPSHTSGFYSQIDAWSLNHNMDDVQIYYTSDLSNPGLESIPYDDAFEISENSTIRFFATKDGYISSTIESVTIITDEVEYDIDVVFVDTDPSNLWDDGIYENPYENTEIETNCTYIKPNGDVVFNQNLGMKIHAPDGIDQKSLRFYSRSDYGQSKIETELFDSKPYDGYKRFILRNGGNDALNLSRTLQRDILASVTWSNLNPQYGWSAFQPVHLYLNGEYWGVYNLRERQDNYWLEQNFGYGPDEVDYLERTASIPSTYSVFSGNWDDYDLMEQTAIDLDLSDEDNYEVIKNWIDINNFIDYQFTEIFYGNKDWLSNNIKLWRPHDPSGKWQWILWDMDYGLGCYHPIYDHGFPDWNTLSFALSNWGGWTSQVETELLQNLVENDNFVDSFASRGADIMNSYYRIDNILAHLQNNIEAVENEIPYHVERWDLSSVMWDAKLLALQEYLQQRAPYVFQHFTEQFDLGEIQPLHLDVYPPGAGYIEVNTIETDQTPWDGFYYENIPVRIKAVPNFGYEFVNWNEVETDIELFLNMNDSISMTAFFEQIIIDDTQMIINEIHYQESDEFDTGEWIELYNPNEFDVNLLNWVLEDGAENQYVIPEVTIPANAYFLLISDSSKFELYFPEIENYVGEFEFNLSNEGELLQLKNPFGIAIDLVDYEIEDPWPILTESYTASIQLLEPELDNNHGPNWFTNELDGGTPDAVNQIFIGIEESDEQFYELICYPNPVSNEMTALLVNVNSSDQPVIEIFNSTGQIVDVISEFNYTGNMRGHFSWTPDPSLASGAYYIRVTFGEIQSKTWILKE